MFHPLIGVTDKPDRVKFSLVGERYFAARIELAIERDGETTVRYPMHWEANEYGQDVWSVTIGHMDTGIYFYQFILNEGIVIGRDGESGCKENGAAYQLTVYARAYEMPQFLAGGLIYQIMVDRFCAVEPPHSRPDVVYHKNWCDTPLWRPIDGKILNNDFFGGNLKGVLSKLDYLKGLGVTCLYFNPIFKAASNHKYDTGDYFAIDPDFGTEADLKKLTAEAAKRGISVILDGVFSHTGDDSVYFNRYNRYPSVGAFQSKDSPYADWYRFTQFPQKFDSWWGIEILPEVNENSPSYTEFITGKKGVLKHWMDCGVAGWRLDVADELPDEFIAKLTARVKKERSDGLVLGEVWEDASNKISYSRRRKYFLGKELDSVTNYVFRSAILDFLKTGDARPIARRVQSVLENYPPEVVHVLMNVIGTHDTPRMLTMLSKADGNAMTRDERAAYRLSAEQYSHAKQKLLLAAVLQYTLPGVPCVYYGDEAGVQGFEDPFNRATYPWGHEDETILAFYKKLGAIRAACAELKKGKYRLLYAAANVYLFSRSEGTNCLYVGINLGNAPFMYSADADEPRSLQNLFTGEKCRTIAVPPRSFCCLRKGED